MTFRSNSPQYSYVKLNKEGRIIETVEKVVVSDSAICGAYYFKNKEIVEKYLHNYISSCIYDEYFFSGLYNVLIADNRNIIKFDTDFHLSFGTPSEYIEAKKSKYFNLMD